MYLELSRSFLINKNVLGDYLAISGCIVTYLIGLELSVIEN